MDVLVVGVDAGGTSVRAVVCDGSGARHGSGVAAGANPVSRGLADTATQLETALRSALTDIDPARVAVVALGVAGAAAFGDELAGLLPEVAARLGAPARWVLFSDLEVAFAAGCAEDDGVVVLSGTGAAVAEIAGRRMVRYIDGAGWLLGDLGSGFWLGCAAARAAVADREGRGEPTVLTGMLGDLLAVPRAQGRPLPGADPHTRTLVGALYRRTPVSLSEFAPLVMRAAADGDAVAGRLIDEAAEALLGETELLLRDSAGTRWAVLAGGVLLAEGPLRDAVSAGLVQRFGLRIGLASDGAGGAAWRALQEVPGAVPDDPGARAAVHTRLTKRS